MSLGLLRFTNALGGTTDFIYPGPTIDMQSPASAGAVNGATYVYYAQSLDMTEWEIGSGAYTFASGTFARTVVAANSLGTTAKINFANHPQVFVFDTATAFLTMSDAVANFVSATTVQTFTAPQQAQARANIGVTAVGSSAVGQIAGNTGTTVPAAGTLGERISVSGTVNFGASATPINVTFIDVTPGVWDFEFISTFGGPGATSSSDWITAMSTASATVSSSVVGFSAHTRRISSADVSEVHCVPRSRISVSVTTRYYLNAQASYTVSTYSVTGTIQATRC